MTMTDRITMMRITSVEEFEELIIEVYIDDEFFLLLDHEDGPDRPNLRFYPKKDGTPWMLSLDEMRKLLDDALESFHRPSMFQEYLDNLDNTEEE